MKKIITAIASLLLLVGCTTTKRGNTTPATAENVPFEVAKNYFFNITDALIPKIKIIRFAIG